MKALYLVQAVFLMAICGHSHAMNAQSIYEACSLQGEKQHDTLCETWVAGFWEGMAAAEKMSSVGLRICQPADTTLAQTRGAIEKYLRDHPESWNQDAGQIAAVALYQIWPCPPGKGR